MCVDKRYKQHEKVKWWTCFNFKDQGIKEDIQDLGCSKKTSTGGLKIRGITWTVMAYQNNTLYLRRSYDRRFGKRSLKNFFNVIIKTLNIWEE